MSLSLGFSGLSIGLSLKYLNQFKTQHQAQLLNYQELGFDYRQQAHELQAKIQQQDRIRQLKSSGVMGSLQPAAWLDTLQRITQALRFSRVHYQLLPASVLPSSSSTGVKLYRSSARLEMHLLHELDLLTIFSRLSEQAGGAFDVQECELSRPQHGATLSINLAAANLLARCELHWFSLQFEPALVAS